MDAADDWEASVGGGAWESGGGHVIEISLTFLTKEVSKQASKQMGRGDSWSSQNDIYIYVNIRVHLKSHSPTYYLAYTLLRAEQTHCYPQYRVGY